MIRIDAFGWVLAAWVHRNWQRGFTRWVPGAGGGFTCYMGWLTISAERKRR